MGLILRVLDASRGAIFWIALIGTLGSALALGANRPMSWSMLWAGSAVLFAGLIILDLGSQKAATMWSRALAPVLLWVSIMVWGIVQAGPAPVLDWAHPAWTDALSIGALDGLARQAWPWSTIRMEAEAVSISGEPQATMDGVMRLSTYLMLFWIGARCVTDHTARTAVQVVALFSMALAAYGLFAVIVGYNPLIGVPGYPGSVTASFVNKNAYALYAGIGAMACLCALAMRLPALRRGDGESSARIAMRDLLEALLGGGWIWLAGFALLIGAMFYSVSRGGAAAGLVGIAVMVSLTLGRASPSWRWGALLLVLAPVLAMSLGAEGLFNRLTLRDPTQDGRLALYEAIITGIETRPLLGHGLGSFQDTFRPYTTYELAVGEWELAHSPYLENAFEMGVPAAVVFFIAPALIFVRLIVGLKRRRRQRPIIALAISILVAGGLHSLVDFSMQMPATAALCAFLTGIAWSQTRRKESKARPFRSSLSDWPGASGQQSA